MIHIKTPELYISEPGAIDLLGTSVKKYGRTVLLVWSETARRVTENDVHKSLEAENITYTEYLFHGYPTLDTANEITDLALENRVELLIAAGGGRVLDVTKAAGDIAGIPVAAVPTIAATCAAWAAVSIMYTKEGNFDHFRANEHAPKIILADTTILAQAPVRYLKAGIVDTLAKWYETSVGYEEATSEFAYVNSVRGARLAYDFLNKEAVAVVRNVESGKIDQNTKKTVDAILFLAGNVGSYVGEKAYSGFAHPFYHSSRIIPETRSTLHGEIVAFGLIMQAVLEKKEEAELIGLIEQFDELDVAFTLEDIGLGENTDRDLKIISDRIYEVFPELQLIQENKEETAITDAAYLADEYVKKYRKEIQDAERKSRAEETCLL